MTRLMVGSGYQLHHRLSRRCLDGGCRPAGLFETASGEPADADFSDLKLVRQLDITQGPHEVAIQPRKSAPKIIDSAIKERSPDVA
jgi:hypothetical protein